MAAITVFPEPIKFYIENYDVFANGKYFRLSNPHTDEYAAFQYELNGNVIVGAMRLKTHAINLQTTIKLKGLEPDRVYTDVKTGDTYYGAQLMEYGLRINAASYTGDYQTVMWQLK